MNKLLAAIAKAKKQQEVLGIAAEDLELAFSPEEVAQEVSNLLRGAERYIKFPDARIDYGIYQVECKEYYGAKAWHLFFARQLRGITGRFARDFFLSSQPQCFLGWLGMTASTRYTTEWYLYPLQICATCGHIHWRHSTVFAVDACELCWNESLLYQRSQGLDAYLAGRINGLMLEMHHKDKAIIMEGLGYASQESKEI